MRFDVQRLTLFRLSTDFITFPGQTLKGDGNKFECLNDQAYNCLIHFYKRFQIKSGFTRSLGGPNQVLEQAPGIPGTSAVQWD